MFQLVEFGYYGSGLLQHQLKSERKANKGSTQAISEWSSGEKTDSTAKKHAIAECKRRKRINAHINTLRGLFPDLPRRDKARVLTEAVRYLKDLRRKAAEQGALHDASSSLLVPGEKDEVKVNCIQGREENMVKATICCEDSPKLNVDLTNAVVSVNGKVVKAEMATVGGRTKAVLVVQWWQEGGDVGSLKRALKQVVENSSMGCATNLGPNSSSPISYFRNVENVNLLNSMVW